ncbi:MAG: polymer-forming cytoskeletal protein [Candidatus Zixiibacteriota bacterium]|nr:MAG: polymer-forming cytoskeletal protein [candidate division Zixibacteria bacterium]
MNGPKGELGTIIGKGTKIDGTITIEGSTRIDGTVTGKLDSNDSVTIGSTGSVKAAEIKARTIIVGGKVEGNLLADEKVELQSKCEVVGDITSKSLLVEHGAIFHGSSNMKDVAGRPPKPAPDILKPEKKE